MDGETSVPACARRVLVMDEAGARGRIPLTVGNRALRKPGSWCSPRRSLRRVPMQSVARAARVVLLSFVHLGRLRPELKVLACQGIRMG
jgi:hypothetical protein